MTNTFKPAGAALAAVVAGLAGPATVVAEAPDLSAAETPMDQAADFARGLNNVTGSDVPLGAVAPNSALMDHNVPLGGMGQLQTGSG